MINSELQLSISENELKKEVKSTWLELSYLHERAEVLFYQDSIYTRFNHATKIRCETEESNYLEHANAEVQLMQIRMHIEQNKADVNIYKNKLQTLLNSDYFVDVIPTADLEKRAMEIRKDTVRISDNPMLNYFLYQSEIIEKQNAVLKAQNLPDFRVGYSNQSMIGWQDVGNTAQYFNAGDRFSGLKFGIDIPIWFKANTAKFQASQLQKIQAETKAIYYETQLMGE